MYNIVSELTSRTDLPPSPADSVCVPAGYGRSHGASLSHLHHRVPADSADSEFCRVWLHPFPTTNGDGESGESGEEGEGGRGRGGLSPKELDSRRTTVLIKLHCIHTRLELFVFGAKTTCTCIQPPTCIYMYM